MALNTQHIDDELFFAIAYPHQKRRFYLALVFSVLLFPLIAIAMVAGTVFLIVPLIALLIWLGARTFFAYLVGNSVLVSSLNYPRVAEMTEQLKQAIGYDKRVYVFVNESSSFNAFLSFMFFRRAIFLNSELLQKGMSDEEIAWLIGRFIGYLRARRQDGVLGMLIRAASYLVIFNFFLLPYERAMVYTGDRLATTAIKGNISCAVSAMQKLFVGRELGYSINPEGIIEQQRLIRGTFFGFVSRMATPFPHMTSRYVDVMVFSKAHFPEQFARFDAENPGLPVDLGELGGTQQPLPAKDGRGGVGRPHGWVVASATFACVAALVGFILKSPGTGAALLEASALQAPLLSSSADAPAAGPIQTMAPADAVPAPVQNAPPEAATTEAAALPEAAPNTHFDAQGRLAPDPGCNWASNDPQDLSVICERAVAR